MATHSLEQSLPWRKLFSEREKWLRIYPLLISTQNSTALFRQSVDLSSNPDPPRQ